MGKGDYKSKVLDTGYIPRIEKKLNGGKIGNGQRQRLLGMTFNQLETVEMLIDEAFFAGQMEGYVE